jgi:hypothetical protein
MAIRSATTYNENFAVGCQWEKNWTNREKKKSGVKKIQCYAAMTHDWRID